MKKKTHVLFNVKKVQLLLGYQSALGIMEKVAALRVNSFGTFAFTTVFSLIFELVRRCIIAFMYGRKLKKEAKILSERKLNFSRNNSTKDDAPLMKDNDKKITPIIEDDEMASDKRKKVVFEDATLNNSEDNGLEINNKSKKLASI